MQTCSTPLTLAAMPNESADQESKSHLIQRVQLVVAKERNRIGQSCAAFFSGLRQCHAQACCRMQCRCLVHKCCGDCRYEARFTDPSGPFHARWKSTACRILCSSLLHVLFFRFQTSLSAPCQGCSLCIRYRLVQTSRSETVTVCNRKKVFLTCRPSCTSPSH